MKIFGWPKILKFLHPSNICMYTVTCHTLIWWHYSRNKQNLTILLMRLDSFQSCSGGFWGVIARITKNVLPLQLIPVVYFQNWMTYILKYIHNYTLIHAHKQANRQTDRHTHTHTSINTCIHSCQPAYIIYLHTHTYMHAMHVYMFVSVCTNFKLSKLKANISQILTVSK